MRKVKKISRIVVLFPVIAYLILFSWNVYERPLSAFELNRIHASGCCLKFYVDPSQQVCESSAPLFCGTTGGGTLPPCQSSCPAECPSTVFAICIRTDNPDDSCHVIQPSPNCPAGTGGGTCFLQTTGPDHCVCGSSGPVNCGTYLDATGGC